MKKKASRKNRLPSFSSNIKDVTLKNKDGDLGLGDLVSSHFEYFSKDECRKFYEAEDDTEDWSQPSKENHGR